MPAPTNERQALERERDELPAQVADYQRELDAAAPQSDRVHVVDSAGAEENGGD